MREPTLQAEPADTGPAELAHFTAMHDGAFMPTQCAYSRWGDDQLNGPAVVGLAARALEHHCGSADFMPTRLTVDLFRAAHGVVTSVTVRTVRDGRRVRTAECDVVQDGRPVAHANLVQYRRSTAPPGRQWVAPMSITTPPLDDVAWPRVNSDSGWSGSPAAHQNDSRKRYYDAAIRIVAGEENSPFVQAAMVAESTSLVTNLGTVGVGYINGDLTVALSRLPAGGWVGVQADSHLAHDGVSVGTATLFDESGPFGSGMVTAVANPGAQIDFTQVEFPPGRR
jgi:acyl-CoA thioesterase